MVRLVSVFNLNYICKEVYREIQRRTYCSSTGKPFGKKDAEEFVIKLTPEERSIFCKVLSTVQAEETKAQFKGELARLRWRSKFGRPTKVEVDATGSYCPIPDDWFQRKHAEGGSKPTRSQLTQVALYNAIPFVGFGFLDNSIMIICGDSIEMIVGSVITISTMAAAALGNTLSDILGIGSTHYVEMFASKLGFKLPDLSPAQMVMRCTRKASNLGRGIGVTVGCLLGMFPLLFKKDSE